jgi:hypothetical protein
MFAAMSSTRPVNVSLVTPDKCGVINFVTIRRAQCSSAEPNGAARDAGGVVVT